MSQTRRLAAILAADVAGYSRLMGADEEGTLERLKALRRELLDPKIAAHHGRIVKTTGDGMLVEFASVVDAVRCAVEVQQAMAERDTSIAVDNRIELRIGINLGDVIVEGDDLYGDGVNIAARVEALADAGGVFVSNTVHDHVRDRLPLVFEDLGEQQVKNIARPVRVYRVRPQDPLPGPPRKRGREARVGELSLFPSRSPKETRIHKRDQEFESAFLQRGFGVSVGGQERNMRCSRRRSPAACRSRLGWPSRGRCGRLGSWKVKHWSRLSATRRC
jgi:class 3 adenylate cyclase